MKGISFVLILISSSVPFGCSQNSIEEDAKLSLTELVQKYGYPIEEHHVTTEDGYILGMQRIPYGIEEGAGPKENKSVILIQHGLLCSSACFLTSGPDKSLGYMLANQNYDVWLGNARGNKFSRKHKSLNPKEGKFWDFSWHEIGVYDIPAMVDYIINITNQPKIFYIGHSQGTTVSYVMCSMKPEYNSKFRAVISLAPIAYMYHMTGPLLRIISQFDEGLEVLTGLIGMHEFLPSNEFLIQADIALCKENSPTYLICTNSCFSVCGFNADQVDSEYIPLHLAHVPAGVSSKQLLHYAQNIKHKNMFRQYDHGLAQNMIKYKNPSPPSYNISKITAPFAFYYSLNDWLAAEEDVMKLYNGLPSPIGNFLVTDKYFNHMDYLWAKDVDTLLYDRVLKLMSRF